MMRSLCGVTLALLPLLSGQRPDAPASAEDNITIPLTPEGLPMADLIKQASQVLGYTIYFEPGELQNERLSATGPQVVPRSDYLALLHNVLRSRDLVLVTVGRGDSAQHVIRRLGGQNAKPGMFKSLAQVVTPEELLSSKPLGSALVTTQVNLKHVDARETATSLTTYFADTLVESVRNIENTNSLLMTGYASTLRGMLQLIDMVDQPPTVALPATPGMPMKPGPIEPRLKDHEERIAKLERMVKELSEQLKAPEKR
jgi:type II secretory pathway component GspD/PulD (secretin)